MAHTVVLSLLDNSWQPPGTEMPVFLGRLAEKLESQRLDEDMMGETEDKFPHIAFIVVCTKVRHHAKLIRMCTFRARLA